MSYVINQPVRFPDEAQIPANLASHYFDWESNRCCGCDSRPWGISATWPCGADIPREDVIVETS